MFFALAGIATVVYSEFGHSNVLVATFFIIGVLAAITVFLKAKK
jgi:hypothetical protein